MIEVRPQRALRKKYTWLVQSISPASPAREIRARTSPPMSAGEIVFSSTKITPPWGRSSSAQSFSNGGIVLRSYVTRVNRRFAASSRQTEFPSQESFRSPTAPSSGQLAIDSDAERHSQPLRKCAHLEA